MVNLYTLKGDKLEKELIHFERNVDELNQIFIELTLSVSFKVFERIVEESIFNFHEVVRESFILPFSDSKPIELKLRLRPYFVKVLTAVEYFDDIIFTAMCEEDNKLSFLNQTESWLLWSATQTEDLPPELEGTGVLKLGIKSKYGAKPENQTNETVNPIDVAKAYFYGKTQPFDVVNPKTLRTTVERKGNEWSVLVFHNSNDITTMVYSVLPKNVPAEYRTLMAEHLIKINYQLGVGAFEMDTNDGEVRFRTAISHQNDRLSPALFENLFSMNIRTMDSFIGELLMKIS